MKFVQRLAKVFEHLKKFFIRMSRETFWNFTTTLLRDAIGMLIVVKFETNLKMYVEVKRCLLEA